MNIRKPVQNLIVDAASLVAFALLIATGLVMRVTLPPGQGRGRSLLGLTRHEWGDIHFWISLVLLTLVAVHLILHWKWIVSMVKGRVAGASRLRIRIGLSIAIVLLLIILAPLFLPVPA